MSPNFYKFILSEINIKRVRIRWIKLDLNWELIVFFKSLRNCKRRNKGIFTLKSNSNKIMLNGGEYQQYHV